MKTQNRERVELLARKGEEVFQLVIREGDFSDLEIIRELNYLLDKGYTLEKAGA